MSARPALVVRRLDIRRTPGIAAPYVIDGLTPGINITYGPNASGKTTTAHAIQMLLWNHLPEWSRASLTGRIDLHGSEWFVDIDAGVVRCQQDGNDGARLQIEAAEHCDRYILTLHDLIQADNARFADIILRESAGGYDVDAAERRLDYREKPSYPRKNRGALEDALRKVSEVERSLRDLAREQQDLADYRVRLKVAHEAAAEVAMLEAAIEAQQRARDVAMAREVLEEFPRSVGVLSGDELERLAGIRDRLDATRQRQRRDQGEIEKAVAAREQTGLVEVQLPPGFLPSLRTRSQALQGIAGRVMQAEHDVASHRAERERAGSQLSGRITEAQLTELEADGLNQLVTLARSFETARAEYEAAAALRRWLGQSVPAHDIDRLQRGVSRLNAWLRTAAAPAEMATAPASRGPLWVSAGLIAVLAAALGVLAHPAFFATILVALVPIALAGRSRKAPVQTGRPAYARQEYEQLGLDQPRSWTVPEVEELAERLGDALHHQRLEHEKAQRWAELDGRWRAAANELQARRADWLAAVQEAGLEPSNSPELYLLAQNLSRWQEADAKLRAATACAGYERDTYQQQLQAVNDDLSLVGYPPATDHATELGYIEDLSGRMQQRENANQSIQNARRTLDETTLPELERMERDHRALFESLDLEVGNDRALENLLGQRDAYLAARETLQEAELAHRHARAALGERDDLVTHDREDLQARLREARERAAESEELQRAITRTQTRIEDAKHARNLEGAIVNAEVASDVLRVDRDEGYRLAAGWTLANFVRQKTRDLDRPKVFHRARELFTRITQGRYELHFADNPSPTFRATDTTTGVTHGLDELSSATRVQLLMAVRIAFVEEMEQGPKLPLILDETLGNADEHRAEAIIAAACQISREGRQIFYFTAQHDEVGKWVRLLKDHPDVPHRTISLVEARRLPDYERSALENIQSVPPPEAPVPNGATHLAYRAVLHVPDIDPWADVGGVHLWYLVHDTAALHQLLSLGIVTWGQFRTLVGHGGVELSSPGVYERTEARAGVLAAALAAWRTGRGRAVDRAAILDSDAITPTFLKDVVAVANQVEGDAEALLIALEDGQVSRFRTSSIEELRRHLIDHGYLDADKPLSQADLRARVLGQAADTITANLLNIDDVDFLLHCLPQTPEASRELPA